MGLLLKPAGQLSDAELERELAALRVAGDAEALADPVTLARHLDPRTYRLRPHLRVIADAYLKMDAGQANRVMVFTPPQVGKSETVSVRGPFWWLKRHPTHRVVVASYGQSLALRKGKAVRNLVREYGHRYGMALARGSSASDIWDLTTGGGMQSVGIEGGLTGHSANLLVIDDPHADRAHAASAAEREKVWDWWTSTARTRLQPGSPVILVMTRWHPDDLAGRLLDQYGSTSEGGMWLLLKMPALATGEADPLGRERGAPLTHPKIRSKDEARLREHWETMRLELGPRDFAAMCQADPQPEGGALLTWTELREYRAWGEAAPAQVVAVAVDPSGGGRDTAGIIGGHRGTDGRLYYTHDVSAPMSSADWSRAAARLAAQIDADRVIVEANYGGDQGLMLIRTAWELLKREYDDEHPGEPNPYRVDEAGRPRLPPRVVAVNAKRNKLLRAEPVAAQWRLGRIRTGAHLPDLETEWASWQPNDPASPGRIDASVYLAYGLLEVPGSEIVVSSPAGVSRSAVAATAGRLSRGGGLSRRGVIGR